jgi:chromosome condensin MukBEF ATPase and DNA-binding subunit MukB
MIWVAVILGILVSACVLVVLSVIALKCLQSAQKSADSYMIAHRDTLASLERVHDRQAKQLDSVLDRFMALDFSIFKAYQSTEDAGDGGFTDPDEDEQTGVMTYTPSGNVVVHGADAGELLRQRLEEAQLLREDFGQDFFEREDAR